MPFFPISRGFQPWRLPGLCKGKDNSQVCNFTETSSPETFLGMMAVSQKFRQASGELYTGFQGFWSVSFVSELPPQTPSVTLSPSLLTVMIIDAGCVSALNLPKNSGLSSAEIGRNWLEMATIG